MDNLLIGDFEGPLDLLLHLIKKSKMEIFDIEISNITNQYISFINQMSDMNLDIASEYLVMAAELIEIKSRKLLPIEKEDEEEEEINPEEELKRRLLEYKKYKESTEVFKTLEEKRNNYYTKAPELLQKYSNEKLENDGSLGVVDLLDALKKILERQDNQKLINTKITRKELSVKERCEKIREILKNRKRLNFVELFDNFSKSYVVVTFLSILEMVKTREINIKQDNNFGDIYLERVD